MSQNNLPVIFHLITGLGVGGAEKMLLKTLPASKNSYEHHVLCLRGRGLVADELISLGITVHFLNLGLFILPAIIHFYRLINKHTPDILITYLIHADIFGRILGRLFGKPSLVIFSSRRGFYLTQKKLWWLDRLTAPLVDHFIVQTQVIKKNLKERFSLKEKMFTVVPNCIDLSQFANKKPVSNILTFISVGTLKPGKGFEELLEAYEKFTLHNSFSTKLLIVGDGSELMKYQKQIKNFKSKESIQFLGNRNDVPELLLSSDIFVLPTHSEGMSNALLEAMASKLAIITTNIDANQEILKNNLSAILIPVNDTMSLEKAMIKMAQNQNLRTQYGERAYNDILENYSQKRILEKLDILYQQFLSQK